MKHTIEKAMKECLEIQKQHGKIRKESLEILAKKYGYKNGEVIRSVFNRWKKKNSTILTEEQNIKLPEIKEELRKDIHKGISIKEALTKYQITMSTLDEIIDSLRKSGLNVIVTGNILHVSKYVVYQDNVHVEKWNDDVEVIRFGVVSDTHIGSKHQQLTLLQKMYEIFAHEEIINVYHAGDISEGIKMRPGHEQECFLHGADDITDYILEKYPHVSGITTHFITGNHDHSMIKQSGYDIGKRIASERKDMNYLGMSNAKVLLTPNCTMEINHPLDGAAYALSYSIQKMADSYTGGEKPNILINGHHHKAMYLFYRNIHMLEAGCFEAQTPWMRGKRIAAMVGGYIVTVHVDKNGEIKRFLPEFVPFYEMIKNDYERR